MRLLTLLAISAAFIVSACTQNPSRVVYKGNDWFGKTAFESTSTQRRGSSRVGEVVRGPELESVHYSDTARVNDVGEKDLGPVRVESRNLDAPDAKPKKTQERPSPRSDAWDANDKITVSDKDASFGTRDLATPSSVQFQWPIEGGKILSRFGSKGTGKFNDGINIAAPQGEPIWASADGVVVYSGNELKGYGNMVIIRHNDDWMTAYAHADDITVRKNDMVKQGDIIGYVGRSGGVDQAQLHFGIRQGREPVNPEQYLPNQFANLN
jgi:murein DD-endopeptidase MepM/ murein hydrolase activator NlpD